LAQAARLGLTSVHNMDGNAAQLALYAALEDLGEMSLRVYVPFDVRPETPAEALQEAAELRAAYNSDKVRAGSVKLFMDGVMEGYTALTLAPYADRPDTCGDANYSAEPFNALVAAADRLGLQVLVHAIGDAAVRRALDGFETARRANGRRDSRHRVEHIELIDPADLPRLAELGVLASMQPLHAPLSALSGDVWLERAGRARWPYSFAWQSLRQAGARLVFGSDWPVVSQDPLRGLHAALTRQPYAPGLPDQRQSLCDALLAYTREAAYAEFQEGVKGQLRPGFLADLVLLSADIFSLPPETLPEVNPVLTVCDGQVVYQA
jgi:predicted amidohydrolase YtcJ